MNKKAIFIPLLLLAIQPNNILGDRFNDAKKEIEQNLEGTQFWAIFPSVKEKYVSQNTQVRKLLDSCYIDLGEQGILTPIN